MSPSQASRPSEWDPQSEKIELKTVQKCSDEWVKIEKAIKKTMLNAEILKIERIQNEYLYAKYDFCKKRMHDKNKGMVNEKRLFHGSRNVLPHKIDQNMVSIFAMEAKACGEKELILLLMLAIQEILMLFVLLMVDKYSWLLF